MELPAFSKEDFDRFCLNNPIVKYTDMKEEMLVEAKENVASCIDKANGQHGYNLELACKYVKEQMDRNFGPAWQCIMGEGFSFEVTRQANTTLHMYYAGKISIILFKI